MARLKPPKEEDLRVNVFPIKDRAPAVRVYLHRYDGDKRGELIDHCVIDTCADAEAVAQMIGRAVVEGSPFLQEWLRKHCS